MENNLSEPQKASYISIIGKDIPFKIIDGEFCRVKNFFPYSEIDQKGNVHSVSGTMPYAILNLESPNLPSKASCYYNILNKEDFRHVWEASKEIDASIHEMIVVYQENPYQYEHNIWLRLFNNFFPKLHVFIYKKGGLEALYDANLKGIEGLEAKMEKKIKEWKPIKGHY